jgi:hypothetical protein
MKKTSHPVCELGTPAYAASILSLDHQSKMPMVLTTKNGHSCWSLTGLADLFPQLGSSHQQLCLNTYN